MLHKAARQTRMECLFYRIIVYASCWLNLLISVSGIGDASSTLTDVKESLSKISETLDDAMDGFIEHSTLAGRISPILNKLVLKRKQWEAIWQGVTSVASISDIVLLMLLGFAVVPTIEIPYTRFVMSRSSKHTDRDFHSTAVYHALDSLAQIARLAFVVYAFDVFKMVLVGAGYEIPRQDRMTHAFAYAMYTIWGAMRLGKFKQYVLEQVSAGDTRGRIQVVDRFGNFFLAVCALFTILNVLNVEIGLATRGVVAFGSVGTVVFSLAAKDTVANLLNGIILAASDRIYEGDSIRLHQSGFSGSVHRLGWLETVIRGSDNVMVTIPNADLLTQRVCNLSRIKLSQVKHTLFFSHDDLEKLPIVLLDIKSEIRASCPTVITDGSRPFRCVLVSIESNRLEVHVDAHFRIKPVGDSFFENQEQMLHAIYRAVKKNNTTLR